MLEKMPRRHRRHAKGTAEDGTVAPRATAKVGDARGIEDTDVDARDVTKDAPVSGFGFGLFRIREKDTKARHPQAIA